MVDARRRGGSNFTPPRESMARTNGNGRGSEKDGDATITRVHQRNAIPPPQQKEREFARGKEPWALVATPIFNREITGLPMSPLTPCLHG